MKLTPEQLKLNAAALIAFANGDPIQYQCFTGKDVSGRDVYGDEWHATENLNYFLERPHRPKPKPTVIPWEFNTRPLGCVWVARKGYISDRLITAWKDDGAVIGDYESLSYEKLLNDYVQRDGSPCGQTI